MEPLDSFSQRIRERFSEYQKRAQSYIHEIKKGNAGYVQTDLAARLGKKPVLSYTFIVFWQEQAEALAWCIVSADGTLQKGHSSLTQALSELPEDSLYHCILILPGYDCFLTQVKVPAGADNKVLQALPFLIEEKLAVEPESLLIVRLAKINEEEWSVAAIEREKLTQLIAFCRAQGVEVDKLIPDNLLLPWQEDTITLAVNEKLAWIKYAPYKGLTCELSALAMILDQIDPSLPKNIKLISDTVAQAELVSLLAAKGFEVVEKTTLTDWSLWFAQASLANRVNLLQREFTPKRKYTAQAKLYKVAALLVVAWLTVGIVGKVSQYFYFKWRYQHTQAQIEQRYRQIFPEITRVVSPKATLNRELEKLQQAQKQGNFLLLMTQFGKVLQTFPNAKIESIDYRAQALQVTLTVPDFTVLKEIGQQLEQSGFSVKQENAVSHNELVQARLSLQKERS